MPHAVVQAPSFQTRAPEVVNSSGRLTLSLPVLNTGDQTAEQMTITGVSIGSAERVEPALPFVLGNLAPDNSITISAAFRSTALSVGSRLMLTVRGTYQMGGAVYGFTLNRPITVPAPTPPAVPRLEAGVQVSANPAASTWSYTIVNSEPPGSPRFVNTLALDVAGPIVVTGTPPGWAVDTDNASYVLWYAADPQLPYPNHVAPGASLGGFRIQPQTPRATSEGKVFTLTSWNHQTDQVDLVVFGTTLVPARS